MISILDQIYCSYANRNPFFEKGWGDPDMLEHLLQTDARKIVRNRKLDEIQIHWKAGRKNGFFGGVHLEGEFESPYHYTWKKGSQNYVRRLPEYSRRAFIECWLPEKPVRKLVIHFAATGDEGYNRRRLVAVPLLRKGIGSVILENPYYGRRRDPQREDSQCPDVLTMMQMSRATLDEGMQLVRYFYKRGFDRIITSGTSMGGYNSVAVAASIDEPVGVAALIPSHSAAPVYTEAALRSACEWNILRHTNPLPDEHPVLVLRRLFDMSDIRHMNGVCRSDWCAVIGAMADAYIPEYSCEIVHDYLPGSVLDWIRPGHVGAFFLGLGLLRRRIVEIFNKMEHS